MNKVFNAPEYDHGSSNEFKLFLAGTIDMGNSYNWQMDVVKLMTGKILGEIDKIIYNPRRESSFDGIDEEEQILWEMYHLDKADKILMNLLPDSKSPISLLELGLYANSGKLLVCCPKEFYRYNNVKLVCEKYNIPLFNKLGDIGIMDLFS